MSDETCAKCGREMSSGEMLIPVEIRVTCEAWDMCESCVNDFVNWVESNE
jgi:hypothetical protein